MIEITLPPPPSMNTYWRNVNGKTLISKKGRQYRIDVANEVFRQKMAIKLRERLSVRLEYYPPDNRVRDLDNVPKSVLDALTHAGV